MMRIYLDNAASTPMDPEVFDHMKPYFCDVIGNPSSTHGHGRDLRGVLETARRTIAGHIGADPSEIFFTSGGTEADNTAIYGAIKCNKITHAVTTRLEHHAVSHSLEGLEKEGLIKITYLSVDGKGNIDLEELRQVLGSHSRSFVSLMHGNNEIGTLHDIDAIGEVCKEHDALFHSDTVQTMGQFRFDLRNSNVHYIAASAHKFYGPKGVGFLYVKKGAHIPPLICGGSQERNMRAGTENVACIAGMAFALDKCYRDLDNKMEKLQGLKSYMKSQLELHIPGVLFNGETDPERSLATVLNTAPPCNDEDCMLLFNLDIAGISVSGGSACNSGANKGSHVLRGIGCEPRRASNSIRFSFGVQNTKEEIDTTVAKLKSVVGDMSEMTGVIG